MGPCARRVPGPVSRTQKVAQTALRKYGVGSCGPPGFYGTIDVHMELEKSFARFVKSEEAILYSFGFATIASVLPAFAKRGDLIIRCRHGVDRGTRHRRAVARSGTGTVGARLTPGCIAWRPRRRGPGGARRSDEGVSFAVLKGMLVSRAQVKFFKHNNVADLERVLREVQAEDRKASGGALPYPCSPRGRRLPRPRRARHDARPAFTEQQARQSTLHCH